MIVSEVLAHIVNSLKSVRVEVTERDLSNSHLSDFGLDSLENLEFFLQLNELCGCDIPESFTEQDWKINELVNEITTLKK